MLWERPQSVLAGRDTLPTSSKAPSESLYPKPFACGIINLPAFLIILVMTALLILGTSESTKVNNVIVTIKLAVIVFFIVVGFGHVNPANWTPFLPFGVGGVFKGAAIIFFAYIG